MHGTGLAISEEHRELAESARAMLADRNALDAARAASEGAAPQTLEFWKDVVDLGWLGLHVAEEHGGQGFGLPELAVVIEQLGRVVAPGPFVPTALALAVIAECGTPEDQARLLPELLGGAVPAAVSLPGDLRWQTGELLVGTSLVPGGAGAEVFLDDVFVPDADVVGAVNAGWTVARATLANERISIGTGEVEFCPVSLAVDMLRARGAGVRGDGADSGLLRDLGRLVAEKQAMRLLGVRAAARAVTGADPGPEGSLTKLLSGEHQQRVADLLARAGGASLALDGDPAVTHAMRFTRGLTIAGGTSEIIRTQIAERVLGLPRT
jgi:alkylation response protein AidB-like acyl-CoA dehydrogenase